MASFHGLVLAGRRGPSDPLAGASGVSHRALLEVGGRPMLARVVDALRAAPCVDRIAVSIDDPDALRGAPELGELIASGALSLHASRSSPARSVLDVLEGLASDARLLVTTADHALLTPEMVEHFAGASAASGADVAVGLVAASVVRASHPEAVRTWIPLRDGRYTGANLFAFCNEPARRAAAFWVRAERFRKRPWRLVSVFGPASLLLFALRRLDLEAAFARASRAIGARVAPVRLPFAEAAIDVDRESDRVLVERILAQRTRSPSSRNTPAATS